MIRLRVQSFVRPCPTVQNQLLVVTGCHTRSSMSRSVAVRVVESLQSLPFVEYRSSGFREDSSVEPRRFQTTLLHLDDELAHATVWTGSHP